MNEQVKESEVSRTIRWMILVRELICNTLPDMEQMYHFNSDEFVKQVFVDYAIAR